MGLRRDFPRLERRRGPDPLRLAMGWLAFAGWLVLFLAMVVLDRAKPEHKIFLQRLYEERLGMDVPLRQGWDTDLVTWGFYLMAAGLVLGVVGLLLNLRRHRRRSDHFRVSLISLTLVSAGGVIYYLVLRV